MFDTLFKKFITFSSHHQNLLTLLVTISIITISWSVEKILDTYILPEQTFHGYVFVFFISIGTLWTIKHWILHVA